MDLHALKVPELKEKLEMFNLSTKGLKKDLIQRLEEYQEGQGTKSKEEVADVPQKEIRDECNDINPEDSKNILNTLLPSSEVAASNLISVTKSDRTPIPEPDRTTSEVTHRQPLKEPLQEEKYDSRDSELRTEDTLRADRNPVELKRVKLQSEISDVETSDSLLIEGLQRPYTNTQLLTYLESLAGQSLSVINFWLNFKKSFCYVTVSVEHFYFSYYLDFL